MLFLRRCWTRAEAGPLLAFHPAACGCAYSTHPAPNSVFAACKETNILTSQATCVELFELCKLGALHVLAGTAGRAILRRERRDRVGFTMAANQTHIVQETFKGRFKPHQSGIVTDVTCRTLLHICQNIVGASVYLLGQLSIQRPLLKTSQGIVDEMGQSGEQ